VSTDPDDRGDTEDVTADDGGLFDDGLYVVASLPSEVRAEPSGLTERSRERRRMAEDLADALVDPPYRLHGLAYDWAEAALEVPLSYPPMWQAYEASFEVVEAAKHLPDDVRISEALHGPGLVILVHGPAWSMVLVQVNGAPGSVFVCRDDIAEVPLQVELLPGDHADANRVAAWVATTLMQVRQAGVSGTYVPVKAPTHR
jgi:hypothetical protein